MGEYAIPIILGVSSALSVGSSVYSGERQKSASTKARRQQRGLYSQWQQTAFPSVEEQQTAAGKLGQARLGSYQNLASTMASRGFGPGSGYAYKLASDLERGYGQSYADMLARMQQPKYPPPGGMGYAPQATGDWTQAATGSINQALGYYYMSQMLQGMQPGMTGGYYGLSTMPFFGL